jgi:hypothetical protein|tara:strand:+ start:430 stop:774 length:345 start_codon:yes stop_codon:yes gene_type:complete
VELGLLLGRREEAVGDKPYFARMISSEGIRLINICDAELIGTTVKRDNFEMHISHEYFGGDTINSEQAIELIRSSTAANLVGNRIVGRAVKEKLANSSAVKKVGKLSFLMIFKF